MNEKERSYLAQNSKTLKELIAKYPDYDICVLAGECANGGDYSWMYCSSIKFEVGEILDCDYGDYDDCVFTDRISLEEYIEDDLFDDYQDKPDEEYEAAIKAELKRLEPYWRKVITIFADN